MSLLNIFFPKICCSCNNHLKDNEKTLCSLCRHKLPVTNYHNYNYENPVEKIFYGRAKIEHATALLRFEKKNITQQLIHQLKYKNKQNLGTFFGLWLGEELLHSENYKSVNCVVPVPIHNKTLKKRGYNQVTTFGKAIANTLNVAYYNDVLTKINNTSSQVNKGRLARWNEKDSIFSIKNKNKIKNKHILLVDDIITTGATLEACILQLKKAENIKVSIATIAAA